ncbi:Leucine-rich repeat protein kinase family protein isoform 2 [Hibiscus syriacus]|uniref:Leucine-rich repeat protein kinase family protein isoform 2 n=1 Tax=Hibiscus syriacus TaxID=106335 RepID=A0A6A3CVC2_HIBSY|nr:Leucine-rich repeat protein kinase family protein isoform 2 [Hibiscus syriacus]
MQLYKYAMVKKFASVLLLSLVTVVFCTTDSGDLDVLMQFRDGLENPDLLEWPENGGDPCGPPSWSHVFCDEESRVTQIQAQGVGLKGTLPQNLNKLSMLKNIGLQRNQLSGKLPSLNGLSNLQHAYLDYNSFDSIPADFFDGLDDLQVLALDHNNFNATSGWSFPKALQNSAQLTNLSCMNCNLIGSLPDFLGSMPSLTNLKLSGNSLSGKIPRTFNGSALQMLWLNGNQFSGPIDVVATMESLTVLWHHGNRFTGSIPDDIGKLTLLKDLNLNGNNLVGLIPNSLSNMRLDTLDLNNNQFMGPIPMFKASNVTFASNKFCEASEGHLCSPQVMALIEFLDGGELPFQACFFLVRPSVAKLDSLSQIRLQSNNLTGSIPNNWTSLKALETLDLSDNNIFGPLPKFSSTVKLVLAGNPVLNGDKKAPSTEDNAPAENSDSPTNGRSTSLKGPGSSPTDSSVDPMKTKGFKRNTFVSIVAPVVSFGFLPFLLFLYVSTVVRRCKKLAPSLVVHPRDMLHSDNVVKVVVVSNTNGSASAQTGSGSASRNSKGIGESHIIEAGNLIVSVQVLRNVTKDFAPENKLGRGGFGVVYKGELDDGTQIAVKRMEAGVITSKALDEFQAEITVLSKVRHRNLVSLLGYSIEGNERILVYEYMSQGALSKHLFHWKSLKLEPLSWKKRLNIALDVARGMEYLHILAHQSFIHRDLKSSNILLGDDFRAKVSDFGLVKLTPDGEKSVVTRLARTFGYLAPEYAASRANQFSDGKDHADVFSFGVVLMELVTGLMALDDGRPEETQYLAAWFWHIKSDKEKLRAAIDPTLDIKDETFESISIIAELSGHCTAREPSQRPDMGHTVNVLAPLVEKWKPLDDDNVEYCGIDYSLPLNLLVKGWQEAEGKEFSYMDLEDSKGSVPARPTGFADSFTSADGR